MSITVYTCEKVTEHCLLYQLARPSSRAHGYSTLLPALLHRVVVLGVQLVHEALQREGKVGKERVRILAGRRANSFAGPNKKGPRPHSSYAHAAPVHAAAHPMRMPELPEGSEQQMHEPM